MRQPQDYPRRLLVAVTGLSPQIVTETLYALAVEQEPPFIPTEVRLITTEEGAERATLSLLHPEDGWFHCLRADYRLPAIAFGPEHVQVQSTSTFCATPMAGRSGTSALPTTTPAPPTPSPR